MAENMLIIASIRLLFFFIALSLPIICGAGVSESFISPKSSISIQENNGAAGQNVFILIKPDAIQRGLIGNIISRFENKGMRMIQTKILTPSETLIRHHYRALEDKTFFPELLSYMTSEQCIAMIWIGENAINLARKIVGSTHPDDAEPGTIRGDYCFKVGENLVHCSDSVISAEKEISLWFPEHF